MTILPPPGDHGGDAERVARVLGIDPAEMVDLSQNLNPVAPEVSPLVVAGLDRIRRYPDQEAARQVVADLLGCDRSEVLVTAGASEAIALLASVSPVGRVDPPEFSLYERHLERLEDLAPRWRSNPHNPTGVLASPEETAEVWDEAFYPLATGEWTRGDAGLATIGSFTKLLACPGLRIGYLASRDTDLVKRLEVRQSLWSVGSLALWVVTAMAPMIDLGKWSAEVDQLRGDQARLLETAGLAPRPSDANWMLVDVPPGFRESLATSGVLVRDCSSFGMPSTVRIAVGNEVEQRRLTRALEIWKDTC